VIDSNTWKQTSSKPDGANLYGAEHIEFSYFGTLRHRTFLYSDSLGSIQERYLETGELTGRSIDTGGFILAFVPTSKGSTDTFYACDASRGLLHIDLTLREVKILSLSTKDGEQIHYCDALVVSPGETKVYISDASDIRPWLTYRAFPRVESKLK